MLNLRTALTDTRTTSVRGLRSALSSERSSVTELLRTHLIHQRYLSLGGFAGRLGLPTTPVQFTADGATRTFRGGEIKTLATGVKALARLESSIFFVGIRCDAESDHDGGSPHDEPYFIVAIDTGDGRPFVKKFGEFANVDTHTEIGIGEMLVRGVAPNPMAIRVVAYENDDGDPDATAKKIQDEVVGLSQQAASLASASSAADGPGVGVAAGAGTVGAIAAGPIGALVAAGIVQVLGLGDDFVGQSVSDQFFHSDNVGTPPILGQFQGNDFNTQMVVNGGTEGAYTLFFFVETNQIEPPHEV